MLYGTSLREPSSNWSTSVVLLSVHDSALTKYSVGMGYDQKDKKLESNGFSGEVQDRHSVAGG